MTPDEQDSPVVSLARDVERNVRRLGDVEKLVRQLSADVAGLTRRLGAGGSSDVAAVRAWLLADDVDQAVTDLADLVAWLDRVYLHYPGAELRSCWLWHPDVVEELWWLRRAHAEAYDPETGSWLRVGDWHDRQRPGVIQRVAKSIGSCELALHAPGARRHRPPQPVPLTTAAYGLAEWVAGGVSAEAPAPTTEQLAEAERHDAELHRSAR